MQCHQMFVREDCQKKGCRRLIKFHPTSTCSSPLMWTSGVQQMRGKRTREHKHEGQLAMQLTCNAITEFSCGHLKETAGVSCDKKAFWRMNLWVTRFTFVKDYLSRLYAGLVSLNFFLLGSVVIKRACALSISGVAFYL